MRAQTVTRSALSGVVATKCSIAKKDAEKIIYETFNQIKNEVKSGNRVRVNGFGIFDSVLRKGKVGTDFSRGVRITIPAHKVPIFRADKNFKKKIK